MIRVAAHPVAGPTAAGPGMCIARLVGVSQDLDERCVLRGVDLDVARGAVVGVLGGNGAGKSTLLRLLATLLAPTSGRVELFGMDARKLPAETRRRIGYVGHASLLYRELSALANIEFFARLYGVADARGQAERALERLGLADRRDDPVRLLSRGMVQRVALARALVHGPDLVLLDEPLTGLDTRSAALASDAIQAARARGAAVVITGHRDDECIALADRVVALRDGCVHLDDPRGGAAHGGPRFGRTEGV